MNKTRIKEAALTIKNRIRSAARKFSGNKTVSAEGKGAKPFSSSRSVSGKGKDATGDRSK
jgi:hypothetical protein